MILLITFYPQYVDNGDKVVECYYVGILIVNSRTVYN